MRKIKRLIRNIKWLMKYNLNVFTSPCSDELFPPIKIEIEGKIKGEDILLSTKRGDNGTGRFG